MYYATSSIETVAKGATKAGLIEWVKKLHSENIKLRAALSQAMALLHEMPIKHPQQAERRATLDALSAHDQKLGLYEQSEPPLVHVGRDGQPHNGPRAACTICFMWDQIASNEQDVNGIPCHEGTTCFNRECARLGCLLDREQR